MAGDLEFKYISWGKLKDELDNNGVEDDDVIWLNEVGTITILKPMPTAGHIPAFAISGAISPLSEEFEDYSGLGEGDE
jgi:hypothetical protein